MGGRELAMLMGAALGKPVSVARMIGMVSALLPGIYLLARNAGAAASGIRSGSSWRSARSSRSSQGAWHAVNSTGLSSANAPHRPRARDCWRPKGFAERMVTVPKAFSASSADHSFEG